MIIKPPYEQALIGVVVYRRWAKENERKKKKWPRRRVSPGPEKTTKKAQETSAPGPIPPSLVVSPSSRLLWRGRCGGTMRVVLVPRPRVVPSPSSRPCRCRPHRLRRCRPRRCRCRPLHCRPVVPFVVVVVIVVLVVPAPIAPRSYPASSCSQWWSGCLGDGPAIPSEGLITTTRRRRHCQSSDTPCEQLFAAVGVAG
jgi:hypothetical protein